MKVLRSVLFPLATLVLSGMMFFVLGELVCRIAFPDEQLRYITDDRALYRFDANQRGFQLLATGEPTPLTEINELGFRGPALRDAPGGRLLVLGDSFAFGSGVADSETFAARIDAALGERVQVVNGGQPGYGVYQMGETLDRVSERVWPRRLLLVIWQGDFLRQPLAPKEHERFLHRDRMLKRIKISVFATHLVRLFERAVIGTGVDRGLLQVGETEVPEETNALIESHLAGMRRDLPRIRAIHQRARAWGDGLILVFWPKEGFAGESEPGLAAALTAELADFAVREGFPFITTQRVLTASNSADLLIPGDWHPTAYAHCIVAQHLVAWLEKLGEEIETPVQCEPPRSAGS